MTPSTRARLPLLCALFALAFSVALNIVSISVIRRNVVLGKVDDSRYTYEGDDYPNQLPIRLPPAALTIENADDRFGIADYRAWGDWRSTDYFPHNGFVKLGPNKREFAVAMFHQMHCLQMMREGVISGKSSRHVRHCFNLLRQAVLCAADITLDPLDSIHNGVPTGADGLGTTHVCRDWTKVYDFVWENQRDTELWADFKDRRPGQNETA